MTADFRSNALEDATSVIQELYKAHTGRTDFARVVEEHFSELFGSPQAFGRIPRLDVRHPPESHRDRALVRFRAMVQDTSLSTEMFLSRFTDGSCGGWGIEEAEGGTESSAQEVDYANLQECNVFWATTVPAETTWCADELDSSCSISVDPSFPIVEAVPASRRAHKYPHAELEHIGVQVKIYERELGETFKSTDIVTFVGILSPEPCGSDHEPETTSIVPTLHVLFAKSHASNVVPRPFPRVEPRNRENSTVHTSDDSFGEIARDTTQLRDDLIAWIADEALGGDRCAAEWTLFSCIARVQSRHPPLLPPPLVVSNFPPPPPVASTSAAPALPLPTLSVILGLLLPLTHTLSLSLDSLNKTTFTPESKDEDLHAGVLQVPKGTVLLVSEGEVREGQLYERGVLNVRALQEVMDSQTLAYVFPFSQFSFATDISCIVLAEGRKSTFFKTELNIPLNAATGSGAASALYKPANQVKLPPRDKLEAFRDLVVGARYGKVEVPEATSEHIQTQFVRERRDDRSVTADDLIRWMSVSKLCALSLHEPTLSIPTWQRAKALDDQRRAALVTGL